MRLRPIHMLGSGPSVSVIANALSRQISLLPCLVASVGDEGSMDVLFNHLLLVRVGNQMTRPRSKKEQDWGRYLMFSKKDINVVLKNIHARGNVTGVDLQVDQELELKKSLHIETPFAFVDFNAGPNCKITFGKGMKRKDED